MSKDYRGTVFLPKTDFPMKAGLPEREPLRLAAWAEAGLWEALRADAQDRPLFVLHDGPPYANGHLHMGTALNKVLKDVVNRNQQMLGKNANYVPGWDCHGLPIEWQVEQEYRKKGKDKDQVPIVQFRKECRAYAQKWIDVQRAEFRRLGCVGDWDNPYATMDFASEAAIFEEVAKFLLDGTLYRGLKSVMWSVVEKTALAEAEVEYHDHTSHTIWVKFPFAGFENPTAGSATVDQHESFTSNFNGASFVIWTTTPWTIPANRALAYGEEITYALIEVDGSGERLVIAADLLGRVQAETSLGMVKEVLRFPGSALAGIMVHHPLAGLAGGYDFEVPLLAGDFVTTEQGTGLVHIAPSHGEDDFELGARHGLEVPETVAGDGHYTAAAAGFEGLHVFKAHEPVIAALQEKGNLLGRGTLVHSYPHSWRSKAPLIFRATAQWFIPMEGDGRLREKALSAIDATRFVPEKGQNRLRAMIETRPDWCVSRQRAWGVPIAVFVHKTTGAVLRDPAVCARIADAFREEGADAWWTRDPQAFLGEAYRAADYEKVDDILDVWFESGSTHAFVLEQRQDLRWPADLYLEGSDQHRGWFHSSLLESCGTRGRAPYDAVLTHGFVVDSDGRKMSKSLGNVTSPMDLMKTHGADILRLWVVSGDYADDIRIGPEILAGQADAYRRLRNTLRYLLANLEGYSAAERIEPAVMPELERWVLHRLAEFDRLVRSRNADYDFPAIASALHNFCATDLSAFWFDVRKDALYCDRTDSPRRRAARTVLDAVFECLVAWLAPVLVFTAEEAFEHRHGKGAGSVHRRLFPEPPADWSDPVLAERWEQVRRVRRVVTGALEVERREKRIGSSLQARPRVFLTEADKAALAGLDMAELCITSGIDLDTGAAPEGAFRLDDVEGIAVVSAPAQGEKCLRCWQVLPEVDGHGDGLCRRCQDAVAKLEEAA